MEDNTLVSEIRRQHYKLWKPIWIENNNGIVTDDITDHTWKLIIDRKSSIGGLCIKDNERIYAILHYVFHNITGSKNPVCFMQDLFVLPEHRNKGYAKILINHLFQLSKERNWSWTYWFLDKSNEAGRRLYSRSGHKLDMDIYMRMNSMEIILNENKSAS